MNAKKQQWKAYTHRKAKVTILSAQNNNPSSTAPCRRTTAARGRTKAAAGRLVLWPARRTSTSEKKMPFASQGCIFSKHHFSRASREGTQGCGEPHALALRDKALRSQRHAIMHDPHSVVSSASAQRQLIWHAGNGEAGPRRGAFTGCRLCRRPPMPLPLPTKEAFVLRMDAAFAAMGAWDARSEAAWAAWRAARAAGG